VVTGRMRSVLVDWLVDVHQQFHLLAETLYLTVAIIDRYLQVGLKTAQGICCLIYNILFYSVCTVKLLSIIPRCIIFPVPSFSLCGP
jgi:hypothetical protein